MALPTFDQPELERLTRPLRSSSTRSARNRWPFITPSTSTVPTSSGCTCLTAKARSATGARSSWGCRASRYDRWTGMRNAIEITGPLTPTARDLFVRLEPSIELFDPEHKLWDYELVQDG